MTSPRGSTHKIMSRRLNREVERGLWGGLGKGEWGTQGGLEVRLACRTKSQAGLGRCLEPRKNITVNEMVISQISIQGVLEDWRGSIETPLDGKLPRRRYTLQCEGLIGGRGSNGAARRGQVNVKESNGWEAARRATSSEVDAWGE